VIRNSASSPREASRQIQWGGDGKAHSIAGSYDDLRRQHRDANSYAPGLLDAIDQRLTGHSVADPELAELVDAVVAHHAAA